MTISLVWLVAVVVTAWLVERRRRRAVVQLAREVATMESLRDRSGEIGGFAENARRYLGATSSIVATVRGKSHVLEIRDFANVALSRIRERERDIRKGPFQTTTPLWHESFLDDGTITLLVPLVVRGRKVGFWMLSFAEASAPVDLVTNLARELACALDDADAKPAPIAVLRRGFADHADLARLCEAMPYGVFVMTVWGHLRYANTAMKLACATCGIDLDARDPVALLGALTQHDDVLAQLREFVRSQAPMCLRGQRGSVALSWLATDDERLVVGWVLPGDRVESPALLASMSMTSIAAPVVGPSGTLRFFAVR